jgi:hypothetical protein
MINEHSQFMFYANSSGKKNLSESHFIGLIVVMKKIIYIMGEYFRFNKNYYNFVR